MEEEEPENDLAAQVQQLQARVRYMRSEMHARNMNTYQVATALLDMLLMDRTMVPVEEIVAVREHLRVMGLVHSLPFGEEEPTHTLVRLPTLLRALRRYLSSGTADLWRLTVTGEELWLTHAQACTLGLILRGWHGLTEERQGVPFTLEIAAGPEQVVIAAFALSHNPALEDPQSYYRQMVNTLIRHDLRAEGTYGRGTDGQLWAALSAPRELFKTPQSQREAELPRKPAPLAPFPADTLPADVDQAGL